MKTIKKLIKFLISNKFFLNFYKGKRYIFLFHDVSNENDLQHSEIYSTNIKYFEKNIKLINDLFKIIPLNSLVKDRLSDNKNYASITFDDGFLSVLENAYPILKKLNIPFTIFVNGEAISNNQLWVSNIIINKDSNYKERLINLARLNKNNINPIEEIYTNGIFNEEFCAQYKIKSKSKKIYLDYNDLIFLTNNSVSIASHSFHHLVLSRCDKELLVNEIIKNKNIVDSINDNNIDHFAIPFGKENHYNENVLNVLNNYGYKYIYTTKPSYFNKSCLNNKSYLFPRITVTNQKPKELMYNIIRPIFFKE